MRPFGLLLKAAILSAALSLLLLLPTEGLPPGTPAAVASSGAPLAYPPNNNFEVGPQMVGNGPDNYDFSSGSSGWYKLGNVTFSDDDAIFSGGGLLRSSSYTLGNSTQA